MFIIKSISSIYRQLQDRKHLMNNTDKVAHLRSLSRLIAFAVCMYLLSSCGKNKYQGYIYDRKSHLPIKDVLVKYNGHQVRSDEKGHFIIANNEDVSEAILFYKEGYKPDTAETIIIHAGEQMEERFKDGHDTVFLLPVSQTAPLHNKVNNSSSATEKWPVSSDQFRKFYKKNAETGEYSLVIPRGFEAIPYNEASIPVQESPYGYVIKPDDRYVTATQLKLCGLHCKVIVYATMGENDSPVLNIQLNSYNADGQLQDALLLDSRFTFEVVYYRDFIIEENGKIILKLYHKDQYTYNEDGDITGSIDNPQVKSSNAVYQLQRNGKFRKLTS